MFHVNAQAVRGTFDVGGESRVARGYRKAVCTTGYRSCQLGVT